MNSRRVGDRVRLGVGMKVDAINQAKGCDAVMWHWSQSDQETVLLARKLLEHFGVAAKEVFLSLLLGRTSMTRGRNSIYWKQLARR